jgi:uncharacterized repeat protein (TIGR03803 family)
MSPRELTRVSIASLVLAVGVFVPAASASSPYQLLLSFNGSNGQNPAGLLSDQAGNMYGTTTVSNEGGVVYELSPQQSGSWKQTILYTFASGLVVNPGLVFDTAGNLYGTGASSTDDYGEVFRLTPNDGSWTENTIYIFKNQVDGDGPYGRIIFDSEGNVYGTTISGGEHGYGTVFELTPPAKGNGNWTEKVLHSFGSTQHDGRSPWAGLTLDPQGNLYGTAAQGGDYSGSCVVSGCGIVFELSSGSNDRWTETIIHTFNYKNGSQPYSDVNFDASGNLYGTASQGGSWNYGTVFQLTRGETGQWTAKTLHNFNSNAKDGVRPMAGVTLGSQGQIFGTTFSGGAFPSACGNRGCGTVFELTPAANGQWIETILHSFSGYNGANPGFSDLTLGVNNALFGTTLGGGHSYGRYCAGYAGCGAAFEIATPAGNPR